MKKSFRSTPRTHLSALGFLLFIFCVVFITSVVTAEKIPTELTIKSLPDTQFENHGFHVTGHLTTVSGEGLGNKRVTLESSLVNTGGPDSFSFIAIGDTGLEGAYDFFRPKNSPPEYLRVTYAGNQHYDSSFSTVLPVRGVGTSDAQQVRGTGSLTVRTDPLGADIYVDSVLNGTTPAVLQGLPEGPHMVEVRLAGYQNETMEVYISPTRGSSFSITLNPEGLDRASTGFSSRLSYAENISVPFGEPVFSLDSSGISMKTYANASRIGNASDKRLQVTTVVSEDPINDGKNVMVIMTDH